MERAICHLRRRRGAVVVFTAVSMVTLLAFAALAVDMGYLFVVKAELQNAADAGALAAAGTMFDDRGLNAARAARQAAEYVGRNLKVSAGEARQMMAVTIGRIDEPFRLSSPLVPVADLTANAVRVVVYRDHAHNNPVPLWFANIFGRSHSDVSAVAVAGLRPPFSIDVVPIALRTPTFGPVDPAVADQNPGKDGPSYPSNGEAFQIGEQVTLFAFGAGPRQPIHLVLDLPGYEGVDDTQAMLGDTLSGDAPPLNLSIGDEMPIWNGGSGDGNFGEKLYDRMTDGDPYNDIIAVPVIDILPESRDSRGRLVGNIVIVDFVAVHLDARIPVEIPDPRFPDDPTRTLTIEIIVGTVVAAVLDGGTADDPAGFAHSVFTLQLLR